MKDMKVLKVLLAISCLPAATIAQAHAEPLRADPTPFISDFLRQRNIVGAAVTVWNGNGDIVYKKGFGSAGLTDFTPDTPCRVASVSKGITGLIAMQAVKEKKLDLDKPINDYLKYEKLADQRLNKVTTRMLLQHVSGFGEDNAFIVSPSTISQTLPLSTVQPGSRMPVGATWVPSV